MDFNEKGFLGDAVLEFTADLQAKYSIFFQACYYINTVAHSTKFKFAFPSDDPQKILVGCLFSRVLNGFQSTILLAKLGLLFDSKVVLRGTLESLFLLKASCESKKFSNEYALTDHLRRLKWMNLAHANQSDLGFESLRKYATPEAIRDLKAKIEKQKIKDIKIEQVAAKCHLKAMYDTDYRLLSEQVHTIPLSLKEFLSTNQEGEITGFPWGPSEGGIRYVLFVAIRILFIALGSTTKLFKVEFTKQEKISRTLNILASQLTAQ